MPSLYDIEERVYEVMDKELDESFIYNLLSAYGKPKSSLGRLRSGSLNRASDRDGEVCWKGQVHFKFVQSGDLHLIIDDLKSSELTLRQNVRFVIVADRGHVLALDTKTSDTLDISREDLGKHFTFFLPWAGLEKSGQTTANLADVKAAARMAHLYDEVVRVHMQVSNSGTLDTEFSSSLNIFFCRLLFCFFAEDTGVFEVGQFIRAIASHTQPDGSDLNRYLDDVFTALDIEFKDGLPSHLKHFPYVNGGLFGERIDSPLFNRKARDLILQCGELDWSQINPDIFGSMMQAVMHPGDRAGLGMHYTSVQNILRVISPLFIEPLREQFEKSRGNVAQLVRVRSNLANIRVFDPACGSGNFLVIAYKELRRLEQEIIEEIHSLEGEGLLDLAPYESSSIKLHNFFGIEIDDFAHRIASLSLHLANHQMNMEFEKRFGADIPLIPLRESAHIVCGNAARIDWTTVCPNDGLTEIFVIGNPPYLGSRNQKPAHKADLKLLTNRYKSLDYVSIWFIKAADYIANTRAQAALVATNSIAQGEQVGILWPDILAKVEIGFAHQTFKWSNNAKGRAGVSCVVISLRNPSNTPKYIFAGSRRAEAKHINAYLADANDFYIGRRSKPISPNLAPCIYGSMPNDGGHLILSAGERLSLLEQCPEADRFLRRFVGSEELLNGGERWCLVIRDDEVDETRKCPEIAKRLKGVESHRRASTEASTRRLAETPNRFYFWGHKDTETLIIPNQSSERREYIPIDYSSGHTVVSNLCNVVYDAQPYVFGLISSRMHMAWVRAVAGRLESRYRYSGTLVYNNFPAPVLSTGQIEMIERNAYAVLETREMYSEYTLAQLYDPEKMPHRLRQAHDGLDEIVDRCYRSRPFSDDEERLAHLFDRYERLVASIAEGSDA